MADSYLQEKCEYVAITNQILYNIVVTLHHVSYSYNNYYSMQIWLQADACRYRLLSQRNAR